MSTKITGQGDSAQAQARENMGPLERLLTWRPFSAVARTLIILAMVVPLLFAGLYMWSMWDSTGSVPQTRLAVVNNDKGVDRGEGAGMENIGDQVVEGLTSRDYLDFSKVSDEEAKQGLLTGKYLFTVTIPEDFSEKVVSVIDPEPQQAEILINLNDYNGTNGAVLTSGLLPQIQSEVKAEVAKTYAEEVLGGINELGDGIRAAADGSKQLDEGAGQLKEGTGRAVDGINQLDDGATQLNDGTGELKEGVGELGDGAGRLKDGAYQLRDGLTQLEGGTDQLADGARQIDEGVNKLTDMLIPLLQNVQGGVGQLKPIVDTLRTVGMNEQADKIDGIVKQLDPENPQNVVNDLNRLRDGTGELYANLSDPNMPYRDGLNRLIDGSNQLADGTDQLNGGVTRLTDGANRLHDGTTRLKDGTTQLVDGGAQLQDGTTRLNDGSNELSTKLGDGAQRAPEVKDMDKSSDQIAVPIAFMEANEHPTQLVVDEADPTVKEPSSGFSIIGLIVINFMLMAVMSILLPHAIGRRHKASGATGPVLSAWLSNFGVNVALTALLAFVSITLGWRPESWPVMIMTLLLIDVMGTSVFQFFRILFGRVVGAMFNIGFFALGLFTSGSVWPLSTLPAPLAALNPFHPMSHARNLFVRSVDGIYDSAFWTGLIVLVVVSLLAIAGSIVIYNARRKALHIDDPNENPRQREIYQREVREGEEPLQSVFSR
ncbi:YhgE/Pip domain-containing protein [Corynebacterium sp. CCUG 59401]|nr:YhgE/Pip domain-containing protein [Corynebacterium pseudogenitalium]